MNFLGRAAVTEARSLMMAFLGKVWDSFIGFLSILLPCDLPLFLGLGRPSGPEEALFDAAQLAFVVKQAPAGPAPLHVYATRDAIYVTCAGASLLGKHAANVALEGIAELGGGGGET